QYSVMCREDGGVLDDLFTYRLADFEYLTVTNAANHDKDLAWLQSHAGEFDVDVLDRQADFAMLALQGPDARALLAGITDGSRPASAGAARRTPASSGQTWWRNRAERARPRSSSHSRSRVRESPVRAIRSSAAARSPAARSRRAWSAASGWRTFPARVPSRARRSRSTCAAGPGRRGSSVGLSTSERERDHGRPELPRRPQVPLRARLGPDRRRQRDLRDHL